MQLGTRWVSGEALPAAVPPALHEAIAAADAAAVEDRYGRPRWTLTFLEGRPIAELDTGVIVALQSDGHVTVEVEAD